MLFQSVAFGVFFPVVFTLYWLLGKSYRAQNIVILAASYIFYGWWDWRFLGLIFTNCLCDYCCSRGIAATNNPRVRKWLLVFSLSLNLGLLAFFKYYNFFANELQAAAGSIGITLDYLTLNVVLPVGVSFYTFQTLSYTLDVYAGRLKPTRDLVAFLSFVAFFPQLVAGPIERASHLLPQFLGPRSFDYRLAVKGCRQVLWGFFKKLIVADACATVVDSAFADYGNEQGWVLFGAMTLFAFQIYCDFSGYSDIARGLAHLLGFDLMQNFNYPYFSQSPSEFWRRWHISLSSWFRDYVFIPLGGSRVSAWRMRFNVLFVFLVSGLWHGANWTFVVWGGLNGLLVLISLMTNGKDKPITRPSSSLQAFASMLITFCLICITWVFFRAPGIDVAIDFLRHAISDALAHPGGLIIAVRRFLLREPATWAVLVLITIEWLMYWHAFSIDWLPRSMRWIIYQAIFIVVVWFAFYHPATEFIYFQF
jgi:alginate O-acetyltransferase complex protein AlgI